MFDELIELLARPDQYECAWLDGELYIWHREQLRTVIVNVREPELAEA